MLVSVSGCPSCPSSLCGRKSPTSSLGDRSPRSLRITALRPSSSHSGPVQSPAAEQKRQLAHSSYDRVRHYHRSLPTRACSPIPFGHLSLESLTAAYFQMESQTFMWVISLLDVCHTWYRFYRSDIRENSSWKFLHVSPEMNLKAEQLHAKVVYFPCEGFNEYYQENCNSSIHDSQLPSTPAQKPRLNPLSSTLGMPSFLGRQDMLLDAFYPPSTSVIPFFEDGVLPFKEQAPSLPESVMNPKLELPEVLHKRISFQDSMNSDNTKPEVGPIVSTDPFMMHSNSTTLMNYSLADKKRKSNRSQLSSDCLEILKKYKKSGIFVPSRCDISPELELSLLENYELLAAKRKWRCQPRKWKVIADNLSKEECVQYLKYHRWKEPVTNAPKGSGCRVSQCAIHSECSHLLKMRWLV